MTDPSNRDYLWAVVKPRNGEPASIEEMNAKLLAFDPNSPARHDRELMAVARTVMNGDVSLAELVRRGGSL